MSSSSPLEFGRSYIISNTILPFEKGHNGPRGKYWPDERTNAPLKSPLFSPLSTTTKEALKRTFDYPFNPSKIYVPPSSDISLRLSPGASFFANSSSSTLSSSLPSYTSSSLTSHSQTSSSLNDSIYPKRRFARKYLITSEFPPFPKTRSSLLFSDDNKNPNEKKKGVSSLSVTSPSNYSFSSLPSLNDSINNQSLTPPPTFDGSSRVRAYVNIFPPTSKHRHRTAGFSDDTSLPALIQPV